MALASGVLQRATPALGLVQSQIPLQAHSKPGFSAKCSWQKSSCFGPSPGSKRINTASMASMALAQGREKGLDNPNWQTQGNSRYSLTLISCFGHHGTSDKPFGWSWLKQQWDWLFHRIICEIPKEYWEINNPPHLPFTNVVHSLCKWHKCLRSIHEQTLVGNLGGNDWLFFFFSF